MVPVRISLIGAGSGQFSLGIVRDLCLTEGLHGSTVSFMDINQERLDAVHALAVRYAAELGAELHFEKTLDRCESLERANFVINCAMVGGWQGQLYAGVEIAHKYGYGRWISLGDQAQFRLFMDIIHDMEAVCPDAWYIQSANPVFDGCTLLSRKSKIKAVGLCHGFDIGMSRICRALGIDVKQVKAQAYGINHFIWLRKFDYQGHDAYPLLDRWIAEEAEAYWNSPKCDISDDMGRKAVDVYKRFGLFPVGDTVTPGGDSSLHYYHADRETEKRWGEDPVAWYDRHVGRVNKSVAAIDAAAKDPNAKVTSVFPPKRDFETNVSIIDALVNDNEGLFQVNIPNRGCVPGIANDVAVEVPALVSRAGIQGIHMDTLPAVIQCHLNDKINAMERELMAFESRRRDMLLECLLAHPYTRTVEQARGALEELLALPGNAELAAYYS